MLQLNSNQRLPAATTISATDKLCPKSSAGDVKSAYSVEEVNGFPVWYSNYRYRFRVTVDSGMYRRIDSYASTLINLVKLVNNKNLIDPNSITVIDCSTSEEVPSLFEINNNDPNFAMFTWLIKGKVEPLVEKQYYIYFDTGEKYHRGKKYQPSFTQVAKNDNLISNAGFENQQGWILPFCPDKKALCGFSGEQAHSGKQSFMIAVSSADIKELCVSSDTFAIQPNIRYAFSGWIKISEIPVNPDGFAIMSLRFLDKNKKNLAPPKEKSYRLLLAQPASRSLAEKNDFLGKWVYKIISGVSPATAQYGRIELRAYHFTGTMYFDDIALKKLKPEPPLVTLSEVELRPGNM